MRTSFTWMAAILVLVAVGFLFACSTKYSASNNGLVVVPTQGSAVMQSFSLNLGNGDLTQINNVAGPPTPGLPTSLVLDPAGSFAYVIVQQNAVLSGSVTGIASYKVASDGKLSAVGTTPVANPVALAIDSAGKFLFVASGSQGSVSVFSVGSAGALSLVGTTDLPAQAGGQAPNAAALALTATTFPVQFAYCSGFSSPTSENLYVADSVNYVLLNYSVSSSGGLTLLPLTVSSSGIPTGTVPSGVAVDPCNRFVYVSNGRPNNSVSAYKVCNAISMVNNCPRLDYSLQTVPGSPFPAGDDPGPLAVDPFGNFLYVLDTGASEISGYRISSATGTLTAFTGAPTATNSGPTSIAIRSDDTWLFVANINSANLSQYAIIPSTGTLTPQPPTSTFNYPSGVAVK